MLAARAAGRSDARAEALGMLVRVVSASDSVTTPSCCRAASSSASRWRAPSYVRPALLLADEPPQPGLRHGGKVIELMFELNREQGTTLVMVTHDRSIAARCDRQGAHRGRPAGGLQRRCAGRSAAAGHEAPPFASPESMPGPKPWRSLVPDTR
jgi:hypothetical protein